MKSSNLKRISKIAGSLLTGVFLGWIFFGASTENSTSTNAKGHVEQAHTDATGNIVYTCSMHPQIRSEEPGNCPICGMELVPFNTAGSTQETTLTMTPVAVKLAQIQTTRVEKLLPEKEVYLPGRITTDERRVSSITARFPGRIEELHVNFTGMFVHEGQQLATLYAPVLIAAQNELIATARSKDSDPQLYRSARRKLQLWGLSERTIQHIEKTGRIADSLPIVASRSGYVLEKFVDAKDYVEEGSVMYKIADLSHLWVRFEVYESDLTAVGIGHSINITTPGMPGENFQAEVTYIAPTVSPDTRTVEVRAEIANPKGLLKPNMLVQGVVSGPVSDGRQLVVPASAVLWTGKRSIVYVQHMDAEVPTFEPRLVTLGSRAGDYYIVADGLKEGEHVVTNGNFKLDSAAQLKGIPSMMNSGQVITPPHAPLEASERGAPAGATSQHEHNPSPENSLVEPKLSADVPADFRDQLQQSIGIYLRLKNALAESAGTSAGNTARALLSQLNAFDTLSSKEYDVWMSYQNKLRQAAEAVAQASDLEAQRGAFYSLSEVMVEGIKTFGANETIHYQFCPMAFDGNGATWLSTSTEIFNPYMGNAMADCGETLETFNR